MNTEAANNTWCQEWNGHYFDITLDGGAYSLTVAHVYINTHIPGGDTYDTALTRARLIAAAPELLEALVYARRFMKPEDFDIQYIDNAIKKAKGEDS